MSCFEFWYYVEATMVGLGVTALSGMVGWKVEIDEPQHDP